MLHKISDMIYLVEVRHKKAKQLHSIKYGGYIKTPERDKHIDVLIEDIQTMAHKIASDKEPYKKGEQ